jgi:hypothetical protein
MVIPSMPGAPLLPRTRCHARTRFSRSHTSSMRCIVVAGLSGSVTAMLGSAPASPTTEASRQPVDARFGCCRLFCRDPLIRCRSYLPLPIVRAFDHRFWFDRSRAAPFGRSTVPDLPTAWRTMPPADSCAAIRSPFGGLSSTWNTVQVSPGKFVAFAARPPDLQPRPLMDVDFATRCPLVRPGMPRIRFLFVGSRLRSTLLSDATSR